jgi:uncharacterized surface protein with fasciclin (FAS1) repeats
MFLNLKYPMKKLFLGLFLSATLVSFTPRLSFSQAKPTGAPLSSIGDESIYYKFVSLIHSANLDATLTGLGSYTIFAPTNVVFRNMSSTRLDSLTSDPAKLAKILKTHIIKGKLTMTDISKKLAVGKGKITLTNILGQPLKLVHNSKTNQVTITDVNGHQAYFSDFDTKDPHAVIHGIDNVLL